MGREVPVRLQVDVLGVNSYWGWYDKIWGGKGPDPEDEGLRREGQVGVEPTNETPFTIGLSMKALATAISPLTKLNTPAGKPV
jgi:hypothetical protein